jgi:hypothetical protein
LYFCEGYDGEVALEFLQESTGMDALLDLIDSLAVLVPNSETSKDPFSHLDLKNDTSIYASKKKVENGIQGICVIVREYLMSFIQGDLSWVKKFKSTTSASQ